MFKKIGTMLSKIPANFKITLAFISALVISAMLYYPLVPILLSYPPDSINNSFQIEVNYFYYTTQYLTIVLVLVLFFLIVLPSVFRKINRLSDAKSLTHESKEKVVSIIRSCFNFPILMLVLSWIVTPVIIFVGLLALKQELMFSIKLSLIFFSMSSLIALLIYSFTKALFENILKKFKITDSTYGIRLKVKHKLVIQLIPLLIFTVLFSFLILYSKATEMKGDSLFDYYKQSIETTFASQSVDSVEEAKELLSKIELKSSDDSIFILDADRNVYYSEDTLSDFYITYIYTYENVHDGHTYEYYGDPTQGAFIRQNIAGQDWILGIRYSCFTNSMLYSVIPLFLIVVIINLLFIITITTDYENELSIITDNMSKISDTSDQYRDDRLYVFSNDEFGDLTIAFNKIQDQTAEYISKIHDNQDMLMEKERLASLGQLIGGIAHNLKTPIMSISGAAEGLHDLIKEYDTTIEDPEVTPQDHHDIAKDMKVWIDKIKSYTEYMSDVITAVKGQAVALSDEQSVSFTIEELIKRVDILMKHELKNALISLNVSVKTDSSIELKGNVNSLVQVLNNMISNSIQAYHGQTDQSIDLTVEKENNSIVISITDQAGGLPKEVEKKLFKEMITTKGKNGTGLGLFMSYSTIRGHFNGNVTVETEQGKGTTFHIILPL